MMLARTLWDGREIPALGLGCWAIGGAMYGGDVSYGWGDVDDTQSRRAISKAVDLGIRLFDTAAAYGCGHSEALLGEALGNRSDVLVCTKVGYEIDPQSRRMLGADASPAAIARGVEQSLKRLKRDRIDLIHLHLNDLSIAEAAAVFDALETLRTNGKVGAYGWSTDFPDRAAAFADRKGFVSVQHAMNVLFRASDIVPVIEKHGLISMNRSALAMGVLTGKYDASSTFRSGDVRALNQDWMAYFRDGALTADVLRQLDAVRDLLAVGGRTLTQGAIGWLWARSPAAFPIPGFKNERQIEDTAGALTHGPLPAEVMDEIERVIARAPEGEPRAR